MNHQLSLLTEDQAKELVKGKENEFTFFMIAHVDLLRVGTDWYVELALAHLDCGKYTLEGKLAVMGLDRIQDVIPKWNRLLGIC
jgi:hypothetical protein